jgi:hypothetical protein
MSIRFACPCGQELEADPDHAGLTTECPLCRRELQIPSGEPIPTAVRTKASAAVRPRPPLTNRFNDDGTLARPKGDTDDGGHRRNRPYDDDEAHDDEDDDPTNRPRMRRPDRWDEPTGINWNMVGGGLLVLLIGVAWALVKWFVFGGLPIYQIVVVAAGLIAVVRGLLGHRRE